MHHVHCKPPFLLGRVLRVCPAHLKTHLGRGLQVAPGAVPCSQCSELGTWEYRQSASPGQRATGAPGLFAAVRLLSSILSQEQGTIHRNLTFQFEDGSCFKAAEKSNVPPWLDWFRAGNSTAYSLSTHLLHNC